ncbi:hypothetical protein BUALT_Bualt02G0087300 [Buddleja alternifolia]|uniref:Uncharacterized protein n=1 Tax=Buddleja alternifolia TaxID=168488 RepID=A0AAV6XZZ3_9LAMI|nr:hypothetical protein BUALT_Bualt02G0087300 [Buddleja alternifolia]
MAGAAARPPGVVLFKFTIRSSQSDVPLRRTVAPAPVKPAPPSSSPAAESSGDGGHFGEQVCDYVGVSEAKELQEYFQKKKLAEADQGPFFGFIAKNEISNGRTRTQPRPNRSMSIGGIDYADPKKKTGFCGKIIMVSALTAFCILMLKQSPNFNTPAK